MPNRPPSDAVRTDRLRYSLEEVALSGSNTRICPSFCNTNQRGLATGSISSFTGCAKLGRFGKASSVVICVDVVGRAGATQVAFVGRASSPNEDPVGVGVGVSVGPGVGVEVGVGVGVGVGAPPPPLQLATARNRPTAAPCKSLRQSPERVFSSTITLYTPPLDFSRIFQCLADLFTRAYRRNLR